MQEQLDDQKDDDGTVGWYIGYNINTCALLIITIFWLVACCGLFSLIERLVGNLK